MKTIEELEKEIEELNEKTKSHKISSWKFWQDTKDRLLLQDYEKLFQLYDVRRQTKEIIEMIEKELTNSLGKKKILAILKGGKLKSKQ